MNVITIVTRYSAIFPFSTLALLDYVKAGDASHGPAGPRQPLADGGIKAVR
jgi:hypothetical protein